MTSQRTSIILRLFLLFASIPCSVNGVAQISLQKPRLFFVRITQENGLSDNEITCVYRDKRGFLWIGTQNGLNQYDGRRVTVFYHNRFDPHSIIDNRILSIAEDDSGYLWLGTNEGISRFNPFDNECINYRHDLKDTFSLNDDFNCHVFIDKEKTIWIGNESGLSYFDRKNGHFIRVQILPDSLNKKTLASTGHFLEDRHGRFWLGTFSGLVLYDRKRHTFKRYILKNDAARKDANPISALFEDHAGRIWACVWGEGFSEFDPETGRFSSYKWNHQSPYTGAVNLVTSLSETEAANGHYTLWVGTSEGLLKIDTLPVNDKSAVHILSDDTDPHSLSNNSVSCMITDKENILWIGTSRGLDQYLPKNQLFSDIIHIKGSINRIWIDTLQKPVHYFLATWYGDGLIELDQHFQAVHEWKHVPPMITMMDNSQISDVLRSRDGTLWIGTFNGLYSYDETSRKFTGYLHSEAHSNSPASNKITSLMEDDKGLLWIGTYGYGVDRYDPVRKIFSHFHHLKGDAHSLCFDLVWAEYEDRFNHIWVATDRGLSLYDRMKNRFINYTEEENSPSGIKGNKVSGIIAANDSIYWVSTNKGLNRFNINTSQFTLYAQEEGLRSSEITGMTCDQSGHLWLCTGSGISSFDPATKTFINYDEQNGLPDGLNGTITEDNLGNILAAGNNFFLRFNPATIPNSIVPPPVYFTNISAGGRTIIFHRAIAQSVPLVLHYPVNNFSATFDAPEFFNDKATKYAYRLDGIDGKWVYAGNRNFVSYASLPAGTYTLHVKAANSEGIWREAEVPLRITVLPPFWKTWWFRILFFIFIALLAYSLFVYRIRTIRREEQLKTVLNKQMADMRLKVLRSRMNPHFMFNSLNSIQECIYTGKKDAAYKYLSKFSKLVRMILERSENTFITISEEIEMLQLYLQLESLRFQESFNYSISYEDLEPDFIKIPSMIIQPFVENAIWHGLLHKKSEKKLQIHFKADKERICVIIEDNGIGRDAARANKIKTITEQKSLGMKLVSDQAETIEKLTGKPFNIEIEDMFSDNGKEDERIPSGTRVTIMLPEIGKNG